MLKKIFAIVLSVALLNLSAVTTFAGTSAEKQAQRVSKIKAAIQKLGTGEKARLKLELKDKTRLEGYINEAMEDRFVITNPETGTATTVTYPQVGKVKGHNLSTGAKIAIGVGVVIAIAVIVLFATNEDEIEFPQ